MKRWGWVLFTVPVLIYSLYTYAATLFIRMIGTGIRKKSPRRTGIALTFDDGPHPIYTPKLLDLLAQYDIRAIFFVVGSHAEQHPEIIQRMHDEGHSIGIHHYEHRSAWRLTPAQLQRQIGRTATVIEHITGSPPAFYRPTWGRFNLASYAVSRPFQILMWTHILGDWKSATCDRTLLTRLRAIPSDGSIVVLHDDGSNPGADDEAPAHMLSVLETYLQEAQQKGIAFLPPTQLLEHDQEYRYVD